VSFELGRALLLTEAITPEALGEALLLSAREGVSLVRAIVITGAIEKGRLEQELSRTEALGVRAVAPARELMDRLPYGFCERLCAVPVRRDPRTGTIDVAVPDLRDAHGAEEIGFLLEAPVRAVRAPLGAIERAAALQPTPAWGVPPPTQDIPIPLMRRSLKPPAPPAASLGRDEIAPVGQYSPGSDLTTAVENVVHNVKPTTLIPPAAHSVPPPPNTERRPTFPSAPSLPSDTGLVFADAGSILSAMRGARDRDTVLDLILLGTRAVARKVALFVVKREEFIGWTCTPEFGDALAIRALIVPTDVTSVLSIAATNGSYLGPMHRTEAHAGLLRTMGNATRDVAVTPIRVFGRPTMMILADDLGETMIATRRMDELARAAGDALARIVRERAERG